MTPAICVISALLACYILLTALDPLRNMDKSMRQLCHKLKYLAALAVSFWAIVKGLDLQLDWLHLLMIICITLFIWPRTLHDTRRLFGWPPKWQ